MAEPGIRGSKWQLIGGKDSEMACHHSRSIPLVKASRKTVFVGSRNGHYSVKGEEHCITRSRVGGTNEIRFSAVIISRPSQRGGEGIVPTTLQ